MGASEHDTSTGEDLLDDPGLGYERLFDAGAFIYTLGDPTGGVFVIQSGEVDLLRPGIADARPRLLARLGRGELFGELDVLVGGARRETALAREEVQVLELDAATFQAMCVEQPEIAIRLIRTLAQRLTWQEARLRSLGVDDLLRPVVRVLLDRADREAEPPRVELGLRGLSEAAGLELLETHCALQVLLERRLIRLVDDVPRILDLEGLADCLSEPPPR